MSAPLIRFHRFPRGLSAQSRFSGPLCMPTLLAMPHACRLSVSSLLGAMQHPGASAAVAYSFTSGAYFHSVLSSDHWPLDFDAFARRTNGAPRLFFLFLASFASGSFASVCAFTRPSLRELARCDASPTMRLLMDLVTEFSMLRFLIAGSLLGGAASRPRFAVCTFGSGLLPAPLRCTGENTNFYLFFDLSNSADHGLHLFRFIQPEHPR